MQKRSIPFLLALTIFYGGVCPSLGQSADAQKQDTLIQLTLPDDLELGALVDLVSQQMGINFIIGDELRGKRITLKAPVQIPQASMYDLLESVLRIQGLVIVDAREEGWKRIVPARDLTRISELRQGLETVAAGSGIAVTQVFPVRHTDPQNIEKIIRPFLTEQGASAIPITEHQLLMVTDFASNLTRIASLIELMDQPRPVVQVRFVPVKHMKAQDAMRHLSELLAAKAKAAGGSPEAGLRGRADVSLDERGNQLILIGTDAQVSEAQQFLASLDVELDLETRSYRMTSISPERVDRLIRELISRTDVNRLYQSVTDTELGLLIVTTTPAYHKRLAELRASLDVPLVEMQNPVRFYKLQNANAREVLEVIQSLESGDGFKSVSMDASSRPPMSPAVKLPTSVAGGGSTSDSAQNPVSSIADTDSQPEGQLPSPSRSTALAQTKASVTADVNTNSIIVVAEPRVQQIYEALIERLDQRRPQVLIEITLVTIDTSDGFSLGVEVSGRSDSGTTNTITFTQFGLSEVDSSGALTLTPGLGFNGAVINADIADVIIRTLKTHARSKVISAPKLLVNDNATGTLASISESPVQSINASDTVATTSFAGFVEAGTTISLTPRISQGDHLLLEYDFALNSFTGEGSSSLPPPRQTNSIRSSVTIPDGQTIVVGGLTRSDHSRARSSVPLLGDIPILGELFGSRNHTDAKTTLFVFVRPVILRDDQFRDLKYLSEYDLTRAEQPSSYPQSSPMVIH